MLEQSYGLFFFLKQPKNPNAEGFKYVFLRITVNGVPKELSTTHLWHPSRWDQKSGKAIGTKEDAKTLNKHLEAIENAVKGAKTSLLDRGEEISAAAIKRILKGGNDENKYLLVLYREHNKKIRQLVETGEYSKATILKYNTSCDHVAAFIKFKYGSEDLAIKQIDFGFIEDFSFWLKSIKKCGINTTAKYLSNLKKIIYDCVRRGYLKIDPFIFYKIVKKEVIKIALNKGELQTIAEKDFVTEKLQIVKDIFLFSCYTGLAYIDVQGLKAYNIERGFDGQIWLDTKRKKTDSPTRLPLLPVAVEIMEKYKDHPRCKLKGYVLPVYTNQKVNEYLKEIAFLCDIRKNLTFHIARHTFATTVTLSNGVPIETVSKMLGHKSIKQTQHYARIQDLKVSEDMAILKIKLDKDILPASLDNSKIQNDQEFVASLSPATEALLY